MLAALASSEFLNGLGKYAVNRIVTRTRLGSGTHGQGEPSVTLKPLSPGYIQKRKDGLGYGKLGSALDRQRTALDKGKKNSGKTQLEINSHKRALENGTGIILSDLTTPSKSNLTRTSAMLDAVYYAIEPNRITVTVRDDQKQKVAWNKLQGREFLNFTDKDLKELKILAILEIVKAIKK